MFGLTDTVIEELQSVFQKHMNVQQVILFGSRAKGNYTAASDIDLAVKGANISFNELMDINIQIEDLELLYKVDVVNYNEKKGTPIGAHIDRVGIVCYST
jgi:predicted nucleotidyltransferase